jgi:hypothetical protein
VLLALLKRRERRAWSQAAVNQVLQAVTHTFSC